MQSIFSNALSRAVAKHISLSATRRETLSWLALLIMQHGTISLWRLAAYVASAAQIARSEERRVGKECRSLCDWSSDVCSSDLHKTRDAVVASAADHAAWHDKPLATGGVCRKRGTDC